MTTLSCIDNVDNEELPIYLSQTVLTIHLTPHHTSAQTAAMIFPRIWSLAVELALRPFSKAASCEPGLNYCGYNLLQLGPYAADINATLAAQDLPLNLWNTHETLFYCDWDRKGSILFVESCEIECRDGGAGQSDWCLNYTRGIAEELQLGFLADVLAI